MMTHTSVVQALHVIQKGKRVAAALSQSCADFDSLEVRFVHSLQCIQVVWQFRPDVTSCLCLRRPKSKQTWLRLMHKPLGENGSETAPSGVNTAYTRVCSLDSTYGFTRD